MKYYKVVKLYENQFYSAMIDGVRQKAYQVNVPVEDVEFLCVFNSEENAYNFIYKYNLRSCCIFECDIGKTIDKPFTAFGGWPSGTIFTKSVTLRNCIHDCREAAVYNEWYK